MRSVTLPSSPVISVCIGRYPERKDKSVPWAVVESAGSYRIWDGMTYYRPFPILKNRARFVFILREIVNHRFPLSGRDTLPQVVRIDKFLHWKSEHAVFANNNRPTHLALGPSDLPILIIVLHFDGRLALPNAPQVPSEHDQYRESDHGRQGELCDVNKLWCIMLPGFLERLITLDEWSTVQGLLTPVRPRASPNRGKPLHTKKTVEMNRYILRMSSR